MQSEQTQNGGSEPVEKDERDEVVTIYKKEGETPLEALDALRLAQPQYAKERLSYAGRLDPMAEGVLLVLVGKANDRRREYLTVGKEYEVEVLLGISTDTYDVLGMTTSNLPSATDKLYFLDQEEIHKKIAETIHGFVGTHQLPYPIYSSRTVQGKPLLLWAREGKLDEITIPTRSMTFSQIEILSISQMRVSDILPRIEERVAKVKGDFRQEEIVRSWKNAFAKGSQVSSLPVIKLHVQCDSGAYMRTLADEIGKKLGTKAFAWSIVRTKVGI